MDLEPVGDLVATSENIFDKYKELTGEKQVVEGKKWTTEWTLSEYVKCTDGLIGKMDGTIPLRQSVVYVWDGDRLKEERRDLQPPTSVIYLDKSARPVAWLVRNLWPGLARVTGTEYSDNQIPPRPREYFLNIDKNDWLARMDIPQ